MSISVFQFLTDIQDVVNCNKGAQVIFINVDKMIDESSAVNEYRKQASLPDYMGDTWNSLDEVLCDTDWMSRDKIVFVHGGIPKLSEEDLLILFDLLGRAVQWHAAEFKKSNWLRKKKVDFQAVFPLSVRKQIEDIIGNS